MGGISVIAESQFSASPDAVFALFGSSSGAGWMFDATCDRVAHGAAVTLRVPLAGTGVQDLDILGRIARMEPYRRIDIVHHQPWDGRLRLRFDPITGAPGEPGTRVRLIADLDDAGMTWLLRHRGVGVPEKVRPEEHPVGFLLSKSGPGSVFAGACEQLATMAVEEINADGGISGRPLRLLVADDATDPGVGAREARRLVRAGCRTVLVATTSATFREVARVLRGTGVLVVHALMNEGGLGGELQMQLGERPAQQLQAAVRPLMDTVGATRWFLAGNDYVWPRVVHAAAHQVLEQHRATVAGEGFARLGTTDFAPLIERILSSGADLILSSFVGADLVAFERQCHQMGVRSRCASLALTLDEPARERIGDAAATGIWGVSGYFPQLEDAFVSRYRHRFGDLAPPLSSFSEAAYEALHLYAGAARQAGEDDPRAVARQLRCSRWEFPRGKVVVDGPETVLQDLFIAQAVPGGFQVSRAS